MTAVHGPGFPETGGSVDGLHDRQKADLWAVLITLCAAFLYSAVVAAHQTQAVREHTLHMDQQQLLVHVTLPHVTVPQDMGECTRCWDFFYQGDCVAGPREISGAVVAQKPKGGDTFNLFTIYNVGSGPICVSWRTL